MKGELVHSTCYSTIMDLTHVHCKEKLQYLTEKGDHSDFAGFIALSLK